ncbi:unnamed protein product [Camellia sinensis]
MLAGNLVFILTDGAIHAVCSFLWPQNYDWDTTKQITMVEKEKSELPAEELKEEKLIREKVWIVKWGVGFTVVIVLLWPLLSLPASKFSNQCLNLHFLCSHFCEIGLPGIRTKALIL